MTAFRTSAARARRAQRVQQFRRALRSVVGGVVPPRRERRVAGGHDHVDRRRDRGRWPPRAPGSRSRSPPQLARIDVPISRPGPPDRASARGTCSGPGAGSTCRSRWAEDGPALPCPDRPVERSQDGPAGADDLDGRRVQGPARRRPSGWHAGQDRGSAPRALIRRPRRTSPGPPEAKTPFRRGPTPSTTSSRRPGRGSARSGTDAGRARSWPATIVGSSSMSRRAAASSGTSKIPIPMLSAAQRRADEDDHAVRESRLNRSKWAVQAAISSSVIVSGVNPGRVGRWKEIQVVGIMPRATSPFRCTDFRPDRMNTRPPTNCRPSPRACRGS